MLPKSPNQDIYDNIGYTSLQNEILWYKKEVDHLQTTLFDREKEIYDLKKSLTKLEEEIAKLTKKWSNL